MRELTEIDRSILTLIGTCENTPQADIIRPLLKKTGESYLYARIRTLQAWGLLTKTGPGNRRILNLTRSGRKVLQTEEASA